MCNELPMLLLPHDSTCNYLRVPDIILHHHEINSSESY